VDAPLGALLTKLKAKGIYNDPLVVIASKHSQASINSALYSKIKPPIVTNLAAVPVASQTSDDIAAYLPQSLRLHKNCGQKPKSWLRKRLNSFYHLRLEV
jgi:predicted AlkP superfamily pyrophosphatase or phosphodiesterase